MFCKKCGGPIEHGTLFCGRCGAKIDVDNAEIKVASVEKSFDNKAEVKSSSSILILSICSLLSPYVLNMVGMSLISPIVSLVLGIIARVKAVKYKKAYGISDENEKASDVLSFLALIMSIVNIVTTTIFWIFYIGFILLIVIVNIMGQM